MQDPSGMLKRKWIKTVRRTDFETSDTRPLTEILRDKWLLHDEFDEIRDTKEFKEIIESLS